MYALLLLHVWQKRRFLAGLLGSLWIYAVHWSTMDNVRQSRRKMGTWNLRPATYIGSVQGTFPLQFKTRPFVHFPYSSWLDVNTDYLYLLVGAVAHILGNPLIDLQPSWWILGLCSFYTSCHPQPLPLMFLFPILSMFVCLFVRLFFCMLEEISFCC